MDLNDLAIETEKTFEVHLEHPKTGAKLYNGDVPMVVLVYGEQSESYQKAQKAILNKRLAMQGKKRGNTMTADELEAETLELMSKAVAGWSGLTMGGQEFPYSVDNARKLLQNKSFVWIRDQIDQAITDTANFMKS